MPRPLLYQPRETRQLADALRFEQDTERDIWRLGFDRQSDDDIDGLTAFAQPKPLPIIVSERPDARVMQAQQQTQQSAPTEMPSRAVTTPAATGVAPAQRPAGASGSPAPMPTGEGAATGGGSHPEQQAIAYREALAAGLDDEGARILVAVTETEGGLTGAIGDQGQSSGGYQFHERGEMPGFRAWLQRQGIQGDPAHLVHDIRLTTRYAATGYLGQAIAAGRAAGLSGADLATYVQANGQRSVDPGKTGQNYQRLYGGQGAPAPNAGATPAAPAAPSRAPAGASPPAPAGAPASDGTITVRHKRTGAVSQVSASSWQGVTNSGEFEIVGQEPQAATWSPDAPAVPVAAQMGAGRSGGGIMMRAPLGEQASLDSGSPNFDPRDADQGPRETGYTVSAPGAAWEGAGSNPASDRDVQPASETQPGPYPGVAAPTPAPYASSPDGQIAVPEGWQPPPEQPYAFASEVDAPLEGDDPGQQQTTRRTVAERQKPVWNASGEVVGYRQDDEPPVTGQSTRSAALDRQAPRRFQANPQPISDDEYALPAGPEFPPVPTIPGGAPVSSGAVTPPSRFSPGMPQVRQQFDEAAPFQDEQPRIPERTTPDLPALPGVSGQVIREEALQSFRTAAPMSPLTILEAIGEVPFDVYQEAHRRATIAADRGLEGTDPLAPFREMGIRGLPDVATINPHGRPASVVLGGLLISGVLPDPSDPLVAGAFRAIGRTLRAVGAPAAVGAASAVAGALSPAESWQERGDNALAAGASGVAAGLGLRARGAAVPLIGAGARAAGRGARALGEEGARQLMDLTPQPSAMPRGGGGKPQRMVRMVHYSDDPAFSPRSIESVEGHGKGVWLYPEGKEPPDGAWGGRYRSVWQVPEDVAEHYQTFDAGEYGLTDEVQEWFVKSTDLNRILDEGGNPLTNAARVAAADARMAQQGSTTLPGTLGVVTGNPLDANVAMRQHVIPPDVADTLDFPVRVPTDPGVIRAIEAAGGSVDPERGVTLNVIRNQDPEAAGGVATRGMPFYIAGPPGARNPYAKNTPAGAAGVGGTQRIEGQTRFRSPLIIPAAPGEAAGFDDAMRQMGVSRPRASDATIQEAQNRLAQAQAQLSRVLEMPPGSAFNGMSEVGHTVNVAQERAALDALMGGQITAADVERGIREAKRAGPAGSPARAAALKALVTKYGGDPDLIDDLIALRGADMGESVYAVKENIVSHNARRQGYDGVVTVQQDMGNGYKDALEAAVQAHPDYQAQQKITSDAYMKTTRVAVGTPEHGSLTAKWEREHRILQNIHDRLIDEVDVPVPHRITELADVREARNPTPGAPHPAEQALARSEDLQRQAFDAERRLGYDDPETLRLWSEAEQAFAEYESHGGWSIASYPSDPPGYTLRSDIPRRGGSTTAQASAGTLPAGRATDRLSTVNRALSQGIASSVSGGVGAQVNQEMNPDDPYAGVKGFAAGAFLPPAAGMAGRRLARAAGAVDRGGGGALATLGAVPGGAKRPQRPIPGQQAIKLTPAEEAKRLRLDKFPEEVRADIQRGAEATGFAHEQRRGVLPDDVVQRMAQDDAASVDALIKSGKAGKAYNAEETLALRNAVASQANVVRDLSQEIADARAAGHAPELLVARRAAEATKLAGLVQVAEGARAEAGRTLRAYRQQANLIELNPDQAVERIYRKLGGRDNAAEAVDEYTRMVGDGANPIQLAKFWAKVEAGKITGSGLFALYRRFNMLSGPRTIEVNALSGAVNLAYEVVTSALGTAVRGRPQEAVAEISAPFKASGRAFQNMAETLYHGVSTEQAARGDIPRTMSAAVEGRVAKTALTVLETPDRFNAAVDQFFRTMTEDWAATRLAHQQARAAGLTTRSKTWGETVAANIEAVRDDPSKFPEIKAMADRVTFSDEPGGIGKGLEAFRQQAPFVANLLFPFIRTPYNIASRAVDLSPLGIVRTGIEATTGLGRGTTNMTPRLRDNLIGTAAAIWAYDQAQQGNVTGAGPDDPEQRAMLGPQWQPYSVKIGNQYWSYANFAPFSLALSAGAAAHEAQKYAKPDKNDTLSMLSDGAARTAKVVTDMTVLAGIGAVVKSIQDPDRYGTQWLSQFLQTLIPAGSALNTVGQATDPLVRRSERTDVGTQVSQNLLARIPPNPLTPDRLDVPAAQDPAGRPIPNEQTGLGALNPFRPKTIREDPVLQPFIDAGVDIGKPKENLTLRPGAPPIPLTPAEQRRWNELRGEQLTQVAPQVARATSYQGAGKAGQETVLRRLLTNATNVADGKLAAEIGDAEIRRRLTEAIKKKAS